MTPEQEDTGQMKESPTIFKAFVLPTVLPDLRLSTTRLYTFLGGKGIRKWGARKLNPEVAEKRLAWAMKYILVDI